MPAPDTAYTEVERLVRKFKSLSPAARRAYNEDNTRKDFILPLFHALAWDIHNAAEVSAASTRWTPQSTNGYIGCTG